MEAKIKEQLSRFSFKENYSICDLEKKQQDESFRVSTLEGFKIKLCQLNTEDETSVPESGFLKSEEDP